MADESFAELHDEMVSKIKGLDKKRNGDCCMCKRNMILDFFGFCDECAIKWDNKLIDRKPKAKRVNIKWWKD